MGYILGTDRRLFRNMYVCDRRHNSDHYLVLGCLHSANLREHTKYLGWRMRLPLRTPTTLTREDRLMADLRWAIPKPKGREASNNEWILADAWMLVNMRVSARRDPARNQSLVQRLSRHIAAILKANHLHWAYTAGGKVESLLTSYPLLHKEAWHRKKGWHNPVSNRALPPARLNLERITVERVALYCHLPPPGDNIPMSVETFLVNELVPTEDNI